MEKAPLKKIIIIIKNMPPPPHHVEMWRNMEGFHTSRTENITLKSPQDGLICAGT